MSDPDCCTKMIKHANRIEVMFWTYKPLKHLEIEASDKMTLFRLWLVRKESKFLSVDL